MTYEQGAPDPRRLPQPATSDDNSSRRVVTFTARGQDALDQLAGSLAKRSDGSRESIAGIFAQLLESDIEHLAQGLCDIADAAPAEVPTPAGLLTRGEHPMGDTQLDATRHAIAACEHIRGLNHSTRSEPEQTPAQTAEQLANLAALVAALPQAFAQLSWILQQALESQALSMDHSATDRDPEPDFGIGLAHLHLDEARETAVDLYRSLDAAHQAAAAIVSDDEPDETIHEATPGEPRDPRGSYPGIRRTPDAYSRSDRPRGPGR